MDGWMETLMPLPHLARPTIQLLPLTAAKVPTCGTLGGEYIYMPNNSEDES